MDWNETNTLVMQFLASVSQEMRQRQQEQEQEPQDASLYENTQEGQLQTPVALESDSTVPYGASTFSTKANPPHPVFPSSGPSISSTVSTSNPDNGDNNGDSSVCVAHNQVHFSPHNFHNRQQNTST